MKSSKIFSAFLILTGAGGQGCSILAPASLSPASSSSSGGTSTKATTTTPTTTTTPSTTSSTAVASNIMHVSVNGSLCGPANTQYINQTCVSVTVCAVGTSNCQTINNILLDTGSYGLRIFQSVLAISPTPITTGAGTLAECVQFGDGSSEWGPVESVDLKLGGEAAVTVPMQVVNSAYSHAPAACSSAQSTPDTGPSETGFNGILGIGLLSQDCGARCAGSANNSQYYTCTASTCTGSIATLAQQVQNPIPLLSIDNNGSVLTLPSVGTTGAASLEGTLTLGIGTRSNNTLGAVNVYSSDEYGDIETQFGAFNSSFITSFIDSGSSMFFIPTPTLNQLPDCDTAAGGSHGSSYQGAFCPSANVGFSASNRSATGTSAISTAFGIGNAYTFFNSSNFVFSNIGETSGTTVSGASFDWGLPFFFGKSIAFGIEGKSSDVGSGSYFAY